MKNTIEKLEIKNLWGKYDLCWDDINPDVNILVGVNGGGKSTLLKMIRDSIKINSTNILNKYNFKSCCVTMQDKSVFGCGEDHEENYEKNDINIEYINIFEPQIGILKKDESILDHQLDRLLYQRDDGVNNFTNFRLKAVLSKNQNQIINSITNFFNIINNLFKNSDKKIEISENNLEIQFRNSYNDVIPVKFLSSGEKQMLIILFKILLTENRNYIVLFDEPEISLHIEWQQQFIDTIRGLNPNMQIFISTHSPSIFADGWNDKLFFIDDFVIDK